MADRREDSQVPPSSPGDEGPVPDEDADSTVDAFELLAHEIRLGIVRELERERLTHWQFRGLSFAELRKAVGVRDAGKFNYHLGKLEGRFVRKQGDEYVLTQAGVRVASAVRRGAYDDADVCKQTALEMECPTCGDELRAAYHDGFYRIECPSDGVLFGGPMPPSFARDRPLDEALSVLVNRLDYRSRQALDGVCMHCHGPATTTVPAPDLPPMETGYDYDPQTLVQVDCTRCGLTYWLTVGACLATHPDVVAFYRDAPEDVPLASYLSMELLAPNGAVRIETLDDVRDEALRVTMTRADDAELVAWLDDGGTLVACERR